MAGLGQEFIVRNGLVFEFVRGRGSESNTLLHGFELSDMLKHCV
jgi:hypothetical protein